MKVKFYEIEHIRVSEEQLLLRQLEDELAGVHHAPVVAGVPGPAPFFATASTSLTIIRGRGCGRRREGGGPALLDMVVSDGLQALVHVTVASIFLVH